MSPFSFNDAGGQKTTFDIADISMIRHDFSPVAPSHTRLVNVHVTTTTMNRHLFQLAVADFQGMVNWLRANAPLPDGMFGRIEEFPPISSGLKVEILRPFAVGVGISTIEPCEPHEKLGLPGISNMGPNFFDKKLGVPFDSRSMIEHGKVRLGKPLPLGVRQCLDDLITHGENFRQALLMRKEISVVGATSRRVAAEKAGEQYDDSQDDAAYWDHEIEALNRMIAQARDAMAGRQE